MNQLIEKIEGKRATRRILVTGSEGYLGRAIVSALVKAGDEVMRVSRTRVEGAIACDLLDAGKLSSQIKTLDIDYVIHCAAAVPKSLSDYANTSKSEQSVEMLRNLIAAWAGPIVFISSMTVYGADKSGLRKEDEVVTPESQYGQAKLNAERLLLDSGRPSWSVRLPGLFGGCRRTGLVYGLLSAILNKQEIKLPEQAIMWAGMLVEDAAAALAKLDPRDLNHPLVINIAYEGTTSVTNLLELCQSVVYQEQGEEFPTERSKWSVNYPEFEFDLSLAKKLKVLPKQNLRAALEEILNDIAKL